MTKNFLIFITLGMCAANSYADLTANGYYRAQNYGSERWANLIDNYGSVDMIAASADLHALQLTNNYSKILSDPGSIVYISNAGGSQYNVAGQGTSLNSVMGQSVYIGADGSANGNTLYRIWGTSRDVTRYIMDVNPDTDEEIGQASINEIKGFTSFKQWLFYPVDVNSDIYFGVTPNVSAKGTQYATMYAAFPYKPVSSEVKAYKIGRVGYGMAEIIEISGTVPGGTPVLIKCAGEKASDNKLDIQATDNTVTENALKGVYFDYQSSTRNNYLAYNPANMRVLGNCSDGSLGFVTADIKCIPSNTAYLMVPEGSPAELTCVTTAEYDANMSQAGIGDLATDKDGGLKYLGHVVFNNTGYELNIVNMAGQTVVRTAEESVEISHLPKGIYMAVAGNKSLKIVR